MEGGFGPLSASFERWWDGKSEALPRFLQAEKWKFFQSWVLGPVFAGASLAGMLCRPRRANYHPPLFPFPEKFFAIHPRAGPLSPDS
jgi:hypothetical protein